MYIYIYIYIHIYICIYIHVYRGSVVSVPFVHVTFKEHILSALCGWRDRSLISQAKQSDSTTKTHNQTPTQRHTIRHQSKDTLSDTNAKTPYQTPTQRHAVGLQSKDTQSHTKTKTHCQTPKQRQTIRHQSKDTLSGTNAKADNPGVFTIIIIFLPFWWLSYNKLFYLSIRQPKKGRLSNTKAKTHRQTAKQRPTVRQQSKDTPSDSKVKAQYRTAKLKAQHEISR